MNEADDEHAASWQPKVGDRVQTVAPLTHGFRFKVYEAIRRPGAVGVITILSPLMVSHEPGNEAPYDASELRPDLP